MTQDENKISDQIDGGLSLREEMESLADHICATELNQQPSNENLAFRKTLVHGMSCWYKHSYSELPPPEENMVGEEELVNMARADLKHLGLKDNELHQDEFGALFEVYKLGFKASAKRFGKKDLIGFAEWISGHKLDFQPSANNKFIGLDMKDYAAQELLNKYLNREK